MNWQRRALLVILVTTSGGLTAEIQQTIVRDKAGSESDCACPEEGHWKV